MNKILILYHFYVPDDVVSARHYSDFCEGLAKAGWNVEVWPSNRSCHHSEAAYSCNAELINGVLVRRVWRPNFPQHSFLGRILNTTWMQMVWVWRLFCAKTKPDVILTGTDPLFAVAISPLTKLFCRKTRFAHWCFDLHPEAAIADGLIRENGLLARSVQSFLIKSYATCDLIADLGICMRERLIRYPGGKRVTLTPWALEEPPQPLTFDVQERKVLFDDSHLGLLYSGNFGKAHCFEKTIKLARVLREQAIFAYSARGVGLSALKDELGSDDKNIRFVEFASPEHLSARLSAPDIHIVSLRENWTGTVVPSKFFGAIAVGRPVLFEGSEKSCIAEWIRQYKVGWVLTLGNMEKMKSEILAFSENVDRKQDMFKHCWRVYQENFSKNAVISNWVKELQSLKPQ